MEGYEECDGYYEIYGGHKYPDPNLVEIDVFSTKRNEDGVMEKGFSSYVETNKLYDDLSDPPILLF